MLHNGIEHAHLSILCEIRGLLHHQLGLSNDDIADMFEGWYKDGPLRGNFLIGIGYKGLRFKRGDGIEDERGIVEGVEDKVTQDVDKSEVSTRYYLSCHSNLIRWRSSSAWCVWCGVIVKCQLTHLREQEHGPQ